MPVEFPSVSPVPPEQLEPVELASARGSLVPVPQLLPKLPHTVIKVPKAAPPKVHLAKVHVAKPKALKIQAPKAKAVLIPAAKVKAPAARSAASVAAAALRPSASSLKTMVQREAIHVTGSVIQRAITTGVTAKEKEAFAKKAAPAPAAAPQQGAPQQSPGVPPAH
jgi:hypothetical protein